ncbi:MAG: hypothetical protein KDI92_05815 [Xanthomonadales bacterium]|nr:hypothetical protein [Xanthomonadales bacterium]
MVYSEHKHKHNFFAWAAARAAQRGFTSVKNLQDALEESDIEEFTESKQLVNDFDTSHKLWCNSICDYLIGKGVQNVSYGRAAKLVAVYLKGMVVIEDLSSDLARIIHPPIDRILLQNLSNKNEVSLENKKLFKSSNWTQLIQSEYFVLVSALREVISDEPFWKIEEYWTVTSKQPLRA